MDATQSKDYIGREAKMHAKLLVLARDFAAAHDQFDDEFLKYLEEFFRAKSYLTPELWKGLVELVGIWKMDDWQARIFSTSKPSQLRFPDGL